MATGVRPCTGPGASPTCSSPVVRSLGSGLAHHAWGFSCMPRDPPPQNTTLQVPAMPCLPPRATELHNLHRRRAALNLLLGAEHCEPREIQNDPVSLVPVEFGASCLLVAGTPGACGKRQEGKVLRYRD